MLRVRVDSALDNVDTVELIYRFTIETTLKINVVETVLTIEPRNHTLVDRLNYDYRAIEIGLSVHVPYNPVNESAKEVSFAKLDNSFWHYTLRCSALV